MNLKKYAQVIGRETSIDPKLIEFHASEIFSGKTTPWNYYRKKNNELK